MPRIHIRRFASEIYFLIGLLLVAASVWRTLVTLHWSQGVYIALVGYGFFILSMVASDVRHREQMKALWCDMNDLDRDWLLQMAEWKNEELLDELKPYLEEEVFGGMPGLRHPLVYQVPFVLPGQANEILRQKQESLARADEEEDWHTVIWLHERPYRLDALIDRVIGRDDYGNPIPLRICNQEERDLAAAVWVDSENINQNVDEWAALFDGWELADDMLFNDDLEGWDALPSTLKVYRAGIDDGGWSWTLDPRVAVFFSRRFGADHEMIQGEVDKADVFGYLTQRNEAEVLVREGAVKNIKPYVAGSFVKKHVDQINQASSSAAKS